MLKRRLMEIINGEQRHPFFSAATFLWSMSLLYGTVTRVRRWAYEKAFLPSYQLPCPVISVGNLAVGGTGKTPMVLHLAKLIENMGYRVAIISRGYKGSAQKHGAIVSDGRALLCNVRQSGDEPYLMAVLLEKIPVVVGQDRWAAGKLAYERFKPDILLLDDAYQHLRLRRDLNLLLLDARRPFGNSHLLPRGRLREPASSLSRADAVILTRSGAYAADSRDAIKRTHLQMPVFRTVHKSVMRGVAPANKTLPPLNALAWTGLTLKGRGGFAFSGLANNLKFFNSIRGLGCTVKGTAEYVDHHDYCESDILDITKAAEASGAEFRITTDKDYVRLFGQVSLPMDVMVMGVDIDFQDEMDQWHPFVKGRIKALVSGYKAIK